MELLTILEPPTGLPSPTPAPTPGSGGSCAGQCGVDFMVGDCFCDETCCSFGDCCDDILEAEACGSSWCDVPSPAPQTSSPVAEPVPTNPNGPTDGLQPSCTEFSTDSFNVCLDLVDPDNDGFQPWMEAFVTAKARWESVIVGDLPDANEEFLEDFGCVSY